MKRPTKKELAAAYAVIQAEREAEDAARAKLIAPQVGKFYKYRNSFGGDRPKWWLYLALTRQEGTHLHGWKFEDQPGGAIVVADEAFFPYGENIAQNGYIEISAKEFWKAAAEVSAKLNAILVP